MVRQPSCAPNVWPARRCGAPGSLNACSMRPSALPARAAHSEPLPRTSRRAGLRLPLAVQAVCKRTPASGSQRGRRRAPPETARLRESAPGARCLCTSRAGLPLHELFTDGQTAAAQVRQERPSLARGRSGSATARSSQARAQRFAVTSSPAGVKNTTTWRQQEGWGGLLRAPNAWKVGPKGSTRHALIRASARATARPRCPRRCRGCWGRRTRRWRAQTGSVCPALRSPGSGAASGRPPALACAESPDSSRRCPRCASCSSRHE